MTIVAGAEAFSSPGHGAAARIGIALSHGFTGSPVSLRSWAKHLAAQGYAVRLPLLPGHGTDWKDLARSRWQDWYEAFEAEYLELAAATDHTFVAGLSMGGTLALRVAAAHPVAGVVVVNPALTFLDPRARYARWLKYLRRSVPAIGDDIKKPGVTEGAYPLTPVASVHQLGLLFRDTTTALNRISAPTIVFRSTVDRIVPDTSLAVLQSRLPSEQLQIVRLHNSYHVATMDHEAHTIFERTDHFLSSTLAGSSHDQP